MMALSDIFGADVIDIALIAVIDLLFSGPPVLEAGAASTVAEAIGITVTPISVAGPIERRDHKLIALGIAPAFVVLAYVGGLAILYGSR